ncbi:unnamed protein product [Rhodiola kirilowii]
MRSGAFIGCARALVSDALGRLSQMRSGACLGYEPQRACERTTVMPDAVLGRALISSVMTLGPQLRSLGYRPGTVQQLSTTVHQNQAKNDEAIADLKKHMSQLAIAMSALINEPGRLPSQTVQNPKENVNAVTLRSGKKLVIKPMEQDEDKSPRLPGEEQIRPEALETLKQNTADENEDPSEEERDVTDEEGNTSEDRRPDPVSASEKHKERPIPRTETP